MKSDSSRPLIPLPKLLLLKVSFLEEATLGICLHLFVLRYFQHQNSPRLAQVRGAPTPVVLADAPAHSQRAQRERCPPGSQDVTERLFPLRNTRRSPFQTNARSVLFIF